MINSLLLSWLLLFFIACNNTDEVRSVNPEAFIPSLTKVSVSGTVTYDYIPIQVTGLDYQAKVQLPIRNMRVEARVGSLVVANSTTDMSGRYTLLVPDNVTMFYIAIISRMDNPDIQVEDNTSDDALYLAASDNIILKENMIIPNLNASSGWSGTNQSGSYVDSRVAAPFAILDSVYSAYLKIKNANSAMTLPPLKINWSKNNINTSGSISLGQIGTSYYDGSELYILGKENSDSDEYDRHVIVHEFGHFIEDKISRSDSIGGQHSNGDKLNMTVAFGEGWGNAFSAMIFDPDITYRDSYGQRQQTAFGFSLESGSDPNMGWFSETSVQQILFDLYDSNNDTSDNLSLGLKPIIDVLMGPQKITSSLTSIFSFIYGLKLHNPQISNDVDNLLSSKNISSIQNEYGDGEINDGGDPDSLPIFNNLSLDNSSVSVSLSGANYRSNEMNNTRYFSLTANSSKTNIAWNSSDSFYIYVLDKGSVIHSSFKFSSGQNITGDKTITTVPGNQYSILIFADADRINNPNSPVTVSLTAHAQ